MPNQAISPQSANDMVQEYSSYMTGLGVNMSTQTQSVSFDSATLMHWLASVMASADELRIFMGRYPAGHTNPGRTSVVLWPYKNGSPATDAGGNGINPFNDGHGNP